MDDETRSRDLTLWQKLCIVQSEVKCGKDNTADIHYKNGSNTKYRYRTVEQVLEAAKPSLLQVQACIILSDELVLHGKFSYVKATATFADSNGSISAVAYAREDETLGGQSGGQISGTTSSYARKYALCGLLAVDANEDMDSDKVQQAVADSKDTAKDDKKATVAGTEKQEPLTLAQAMEYKCTIEAKHCKDGKPQTLKLGDIEINKLNFLQSNEPYTKRNRLQEAITLVKAEKQRQQVEALQNDPDIPFN